MQKDAHSFDRLVGFVVEHFTDERAWQMLSLLAWHDDPQIGALLQKIERCALQQFFQRFKRWICYPGCDAKGIDQLVCVRQPDLALLLKVVEQQDERLLLCGDGDDFCALAKSRR